MPSEGYCIWPCVSSPVCQFLPYCVSNEGVNLCLQVGCVRCAQVDIAHTAIIHVAVHYSDVLLYYLLTQAHSPLMVCIPVPLHSSFCTHLRPTTHCHAALQLPNCLIITRFYASVTLLCRCNAIFSVVTLLGHCDIILSLSTAWPLPCYFAIVMPLCYCCTDLLVMPYAITMLLGHCHAA